MVGYQRSQDIIVIDVPATIIIVCNNIDYCQDSTTQWTLTTARQIASSVINDGRIKLCFLTFTELSAKSDCYALIYSDRFMYEMGNVTK